MDLNKTTYKYTVNEDGSVDYIADADNVKQNLSGRDISSKEALEADLDIYTQAYVNGLAANQIIIAEDIEIGKQQIAGE